MGEGGFSPAWCWFLWGPWLDLSKVCLSECLLITGALGWAVYTRPSARKQSPWGQDPVIKG